MAKPTPVPRDPVPSPGAGAPAEIDALTRKFFGAFTNKGGIAPDVDVLRQVFIPQAVIIKRCGSACEVYDLEKFIEPRRRLLTSGELVEFEEREVSSRTEVFGGLAQRICVYRKEGILGGQRFAGGGVKTMQFVRIEGAWRMSSLAWEDEAPGLPLPDLRKENR